MSTQDPTTPGTAYGNFSRRFDELIARVDSSDIRVPEDSALISLAADMVPTITRLLRDSVDLLVAVEDQYGPGGDFGDGEPESLSQIGLQISAEFAARDLNDLAFFARTDLKSSLEILFTSATQKRGNMAMASNCESALRRVRKALVSVESAIYEFEGMEPPERKWFDMEISLQIRKLYWNLRRETSGQHVDGSKPLEDRLRSILYRIVAFRELSIYPFLRIEDRVSMRRLLKRIIDWLNADQRDESEGQQLWQDLAAFAELLVYISHRQELQEHDLSMITRAYRTLFPYGQMLPAVPESLLAELQSSLGLDDELDQLILAGPDGTVEAWRKPLQRLQGGLSRSNVATGRLDLLAE